MLNSLLIFEPPASNTPPPGQTIEERLETCACILPVMSTNSRQAPWIRREILLAQKLDKPILALLLSGRRFLEFLDLHDEDVLIHDP